MGDSWVKPNEAEHIFLYEVFERLCPYFINMGMTYEQFWYEDPTMVKTYRIAYKLKEERKNEMDQWYMWKQGMYIYEALCDVSPVLHAFSKKGTKPLPYSEVPYGMEKYKQKKEENKEPTAQEVKNERLKAQIFFTNWARATKKQFKDKR